VVKFPKRYLPGSAAFDAAHGRLRELAADYAR
jgi:hypothetical protein